VALQIDNVLFYEWVSLILPYWR